MDEISVVLRADDFVAVLSRDVTVRLVNLSASGCLLESDSALREGTTGSLRVVFQGLEYVDDVRITRCGANDGAHAFLLGAEFLWTTHPGERSLRRVISGVQAAAVKPERFEVKERS